MYITLYFAGLGPDLLGSNVSAQILSSSLMKLSLPNGLPVQVCFANSLSLIEILVLREDVQSLIVSSIDFTLANMSFVPLRCARALDHSQLSHRVWGFRYKQI